MERLAIRQDAEEEKYREQYIKQQRDSFIIKYKNDKDDIYYLPNLQLERNSMNIIGINY